MVVDNFLENVDNLKKIVENYLFMTKILQYFLAKSNREKAKNKKSGNLLKTIDKP